MTSEPFAQIFSERLERVRERIERAAQRAGRNPDAITLVAVTKSHPAEVLQMACDAGLRDLGENRVFEMLEKQATLPLPAARWHFIGHLQRRKVKEMVGHTHLIHSVDRLALAQELSKRAAAAGIEVAGLLQVNSSGEENKGGWDVTDPVGRDILFRELETLVQLPNLRLSGLMTMAPYYDDPARTRPSFTAVRELQQALRARVPTHEWSVLSMGMTNDFEVAIEEGATHIRVGTALFGPRD